MAGNRQRVLRIVATFEIDGIRIPDAILKCRNCKVNAEGVRVDGKYVTILCPRCGVRVDGGLADSMYMQQGQYLLVKERRKRRMFDLGLTLGDFTYETGGEPAEPVWPFFME